MVSRAVTTEVALPTEWQTIYDEAVSDAERSLISALAEAGAAVPELGYETDDGGVLDLAWTGARIGVVFDEDTAADGWTLCEPDADKIVAALRMNGVM
ncbi:helicase [Mycobacteroides abscessus subsp. abscessus]|nr:helicase [Mycobacteroides abscessus subsp. abscessus]SKT61962.1 helicase [Mycobacteroides abscessus subsp. abscessus]